MIITGTSLIDLKSLTHLLGYVSNPVTVGDPVTRITGSSNRVVFDLEYTRRAAVRDQELIWLVRSYMRQHCNDPKDKIYALLGLTTWSNTFDIDYTCSNETLLVRVLARLQHQSGWRKGIGSVNADECRHLMSCLHVSVQSLEKAFCGSILSHHCNIPPKLNLEIYKFRLFYDKLDDKHQITWLYEDKEHITWLYPYAKPGVSISHHSALGKSRSLTEVRQKDDVFDDVGSLAEDIGSLAELAEYLESEGLYFYCNLCHFGLSLLLGIVPGSRLFYIDSVWARERMIRSRDFIPAHLAHDFEVMSSPNLRTFDNVLVCSAVDIAWLVNLDSAEPNSSELIQA